MPIIGTIKIGDRVQWVDKKGKLRRGKLFSLGQHLAQVTEDGQKRKAKAVQGLHAVMDVEYDPWSYTAVSLHDSTIEAETVKDETQEPERNEATMETTRKDKVCPLDKEGCGKTYTPTGNSQVYCTDCAAKREAAAKVASRAKKVAYQQAWRAKRAAAAGKPAVGAEPAKVAPEVCQEPSAPPPVTTYPEPERAVAVEPRRNVLPVRAQVASVAETQSGMDLMLQALGDRVKRVRVVEMEF